MALQRALVEIALADPAADALSLRAMGEQVLRSCREQERLIAALLALARDRCGASRREPVDLARLAARTLERHENAGVRTVVRLDSAWTHAEPCLLERLVENLIGNALRHNVANGRLELSTHAAAGRAILTVANSGLPIARAELGQLFSPFGRLDRGACVDGVGLGLTIVAEIAAAHGADLRARPLPGGGLRIDVAFAAVDPGAAMPAPA